MNFGPTNIYDASKHKAKPTIIIVDGERRQEKLPAGGPFGGVVERWVDKQGNTVALQLLSPGAPQVQELVDKSRRQFHRQGFVELHLCPLNSGARKTPAIKADFEALPHDMKIPCDDDPQVIVREGGRLVAKDPCPHVAWLKAERMKRHQDRQAARKAGPTPAELAKHQAALLAEQNQKLVDLATKIVDNAVTAPEKNTKASREK